MSIDGRVMGTYLHGLFTTDRFRSAFLENLASGARFQGLAYDNEVETILDRLAGHLEAHLDVDRLLAIALRGV